MDYTLYDRLRYLPTVDEAMEQGERTLAAIRPYFDSAKSAQHVLEIGCGAGGLLATLKRRGFSNTRGIDIAPELISHGRSVLTVDVVQMDWLSYVSTSTEMYDVIIALDVLEHISPATIQEVLENTLARLNPHGRLILRMPNPTCPMVLPTFCGDLTHCLLVTDELLTHLLRKAGFRGHVNFAETRPHHMIKRIVHFVLHYAFVRPVVALFYLHFYGVLPGPITRNFYCCADRDGALP